eukprot:c20895_g1_i1.p1 GENE.c20895_g1_i1~~c20895_g1_i1.p1  ORF type:complete len:1359 (+),score=349.22 c20895_g1_i1:1-4077(+)
MGGTNDMPLFTKSKSTNQDITPVPVAQEMTTPQPTTPAHQPLQDFSEMLEKTKSIVSVPDDVEVKFSKLTWSVHCHTKPPPLPTIGSSLLNMLRAPFAFTKRNYHDQIILNNLSGVIKPKSMTLLVGRPQSGKSSLLKALAGILPNTSPYKLTGDVTYNGDSVTSGLFNPKKVATYVPQDDVHLPMLTVRETLQFAFELVDEAYAKPSHTDRGPNEKKALEKFAADFAQIEYMMKLFGIEHIADNLVGDAFVRGVSGGERKRVTICEKLMGPFRIGLMDEISTGLDSATTFDIISSIRVLTRVWGVSTVISLLQPPPEVFDLFDDVIIIEKGHIIFHGPKSSVRPHLSSLGYELAPKKDLADFLQEVTAPEAKHAWNPTTPEQVRVERVEDFVAAFEKTEIFQTIQSDLDQPPPTHQWRLNQTVFSNRSWASNTRLCLARQLKIVARNKPLIKAQIGQAILIGLLVGFNFYRLDHTEFTSRYGLFFLSCIIMMLNGTAELPVIFSQRRVLYKHLEAGFYSNSSYILAQSLVAIPINAIVSVIFCSLLWWLVGLTSDTNGSRFAIYLALSFVLCTACNQVIRLIGYVSPNPSSGPAYVAVFVFTSILFSGFIVQHRDIPDYWIWLYWINPISYTIRAYALLEFKSPKYSHLVTATKTEGELYLEPYNFSTQDHFVWIAFLYLGGMYAVSIFATIWKSRQQHYNLDSFQRVQHRDESEGGAGVGGDNNHLVRMSVSSKQLPEMVDTTQVDMSGSAHTSLPFTPVTLTFENLTYSIESATGQQTELLKNITGFAVPGTMTALMGASGAGKTTLIDVIAGRKTSGKCSGQIFVNGKQKEQRSYSRLSGYVEQQDLHSPRATVREALQFSAHLRLPASLVTANQRCDFVEEVLRLLELGSIADALIGDTTSGDQAISSEQRKRVTIGVELVANPSLLFLDEPTSGLDARAAAVVMRAIRNIAATNRTVICTIHQPSAYLFEMFNNMLLLRAGQIVYFGQIGVRSSNLINFLEQIPGSFPITDGANPATYMLDVISALPGGSDAAQQYYLTSDLCKTNLLETEKLRDQQGDQPTFANEYATPYLTQFRVIFAKWNRTYWRLPKYNLPRMFAVVVLGLLFGSIYVRRPIDSQNAAISNFSVIFLGNVFVAVTFMNTVLPVVIAEKPVFARERSANMYAPLPYAVASALVEVPYAFVTIACFTVAFYFTVGFFVQADKIFMFALYYFMLALAATFVGQFWATISPNIETATVLCQLTSNLWNMFSGFLLIASAIPDYFIWLYYISPLHHTLEGIVMTQFKGVHRVISIVDPHVGQLSVTLEEYSNIHFGDYSYGNRHIAWGVVLAIAATAFASRTLALTYLRGVKR